MSYSASSASQQQPLVDFAALLSREYRPARLTHITPKPDHDADLMKLFLHNRKKSTEGGRDHDNDGPHPSKKLSHDSQDNNAAAFLLTRLEREEEANRLVLQLVAKTPAYKKYLQKDDEDEETTAAKYRFLHDDSILKPYIPVAASLMGTSITKNKLLQQEGVVTSTPHPEQEFSPAFHQVELEEWESKIEWGGYKEPDLISSSGDKSQKGTSSSSSSSSASDPNKGNSGTTTATSATKVSSSGPPTITSTSPNDVDPAQLLQKRRNPFLENINFDDLISWTGSKDDIRQKANAVPLILELGVAGRSIAKHVLPSHRPVPYVKSEEYQQRLENMYTGEIKSTAELSRGLHTDKDEMERFIAQRQQRRRQMAQDKTSRVTEAMGTMKVLGGGRGRTITSSLMGPGGTERTGRPSRHVGAGMHETEYIEQLDMVTNHVLVKDLSKVALRQYLRPKLPLTVVRTSIIWQFCIRYAPSAKKSSGTTSAGGGSGDNASSYQAMMMGTHAGAISKAKLRTEGDLSPAEGNLVVLEYCEERPPIQLTKGMATKIVTYYRGDKSRCPVSAGGGDRPTRRKRPGTEGGTAGDNKNSASADNGKGENKVDNPPRLIGPDAPFNIVDWVGKPPVKSKDDRKNEHESINVLPEGVTEILHHKVHGPFIGEIEDGQAVTGLVSNMFVAPIFLQETESTDFLMILGRSSGSSEAGRLDSYSVILRDMPSSLYVVGQVEPRTRVYAPGTQGEKNFTGPWISYQIAKALARQEAKNGSGLSFEEISNRVLPNMGLTGNALRQRLKPVAVYEKDSQIWTTKQIGYEDYPGVDALGKAIAPEEVAAYEMSSAAIRRLSDLGIHQLFSGSHAVSSVGVVMMYMAGQVNSSREAARRLKKLAEVSRLNKSAKPLLIQFYEEASRELEATSKSLRQRYEVAKYIYEELQLAQWHLTGEFIDVHKKGEGTGMMKLTGLGDPSGIGEAFSFLREVDTKPSKAAAAGPMAQTAQMKKITGTEDDLRKLTMKQMAQILRSYGMAQTYVDTLKRWDRVHVIRDLSTKAASDGIGDGLERFARGEKMKLSEQKQMYKDRIQVIWKRGIAAFSGDAGEGRAGGDGGALPIDTDDAGARAAQQQRKDDEANAEEDPDEDADDDFAADLEEGMIDVMEANQLVVGQTGGEASLGDLRTAIQDADLSKDARELAALKRQREQERIAQEGMSSLAPPERAPLDIAKSNRKIIRKRITKTYPDGRQTITFKFIVLEQEVAQIRARLMKEDQPRRGIPARPDYEPDEKQVGHAYFEDEDDFEFRGGRHSRGRTKGNNGRRGRGSSASGSPRKKELQFGKLKSRVTKEQRIKKRKREEDEMEVYSTMQRRQGTSNRKERGSIRDRRPHVIFANKLEQIRSTVEMRESAGPFLKPVSRKDYPQYYEIISHPMDLATIKDKISKYEYRTAQGMLKDFELMKSNAIKFNGLNTLLAAEAIEIYNVVNRLLESNQAELSHLEEAVEDQMSGKPKKKKKITSMKGSGGDMDSIGGMFSGTAADLNLDELSSSGESE